MLTRHLYLSVVAGLVLLAITARNATAQRPELVFHEVTTEHAVFRWDGDPLPYVAGTSFVYYNDWIYPSLIWPGQVETAAGLEDDPMYYGLLAPPECRYLDGWTTPQCTDESWDPYPASYDASTFTLTLPGAREGSYWRYIGTIPRLEGYVPPAQVPEASAWIAAAIGFSGLLVWRRRRCRA